MITRPNSSAFPYLDIEGEPKEGELSVAEAGLTKRELFAAMALQGMLANPAIDGNEKDIALDAIEYADALIEELNGLGRRE